MFTSTSHVYLSYVDRWINDGVIDDVYGEFFILHNDRGRSSDDIMIDWDSEYIFREWSDFGKGGESLIQTICPAILRDQKKTILDAGKSARLSAFLKIYANNVQVSGFYYEKPQVLSHIHSRISSFIGSNSEYRTKEDVDIRPKTYTKPTFNNYLSTNKEEMTIDRKDWYTIRGRILPKPQSLSSSHLIFNTTPHNTIRKMEPTDSTSIHAQESSYMSVYSTMFDLIDSHELYDVHHVVEDTYKACIDKCASICFYSLGSLLNMSFDIRLIFEAVW